MWPRGYWGLPAFASLSMAGSAGRAAGVWPFRCHQHTGIHSADKRYKKHPCRHGRHAPAACHSRTTGFHFHRRKSATVFHSLPCTEPLHRSECCVLLQEPFPGCLSQIENRHNTPVHQQIVSRCKCLEAGCATTDPPPDRALSLFTPCTATVCSQSPTKHDLI